MSKERLIVKDYRHSMRAPEPFRKCLTIDYKFFTHSAGTRPKKLDIKLLQDTLSGQVARISLTYVPKEVVDAYRKAIEKKSNRQLTNSRKNRP